MPRPCPGKRSEAWKILTATDGTLETAHKALSDILRMTHETGQEALTDNSENEARTQEALIGEGIDSRRSCGGGSDM